jgi:CBS domain-containing protein
MDPMYEPQRPPIADAVRAGNARSSASHVAFNADFPALPPGRRRTAVGTRIGSRSLTPTVHASRVPRREELAMKELVAADVMNTQVLAVRPDITVRELATLLTENEISGAPVTDGHGRLLGMVSLSDIAEGEAGEVGLAQSESDPEASVHGWEDEATSDEMRELHVEGGEALVRDIMTPTAYTVPDDTPVSLLARTMVAGRVHRLLVVRDQRVVGIVTSLDLLTLLSGDVKSRRQEPRAGTPGPGKPRRRKARDRVITERR